MATTSNHIQHAGTGSVSDPFGGRIYTPKELADLWRLSENSVRRLFADEPGVFRLGDSNPRGRRGYCTLRDSRGHGAAGVARTTTGPLRMKTPKGPAAVNAPAA